MQFNKKGWSPNEIIETAELNRIEDGIEFAIQNSTQEICSNTRSPTVTDDEDSGFEIGTLWLDTVNDDVWYCLDTGIGNAIWIRINSEFTTTTSGTGADLIKSTSEAALELRSLSAGSPAILVRQDADTITLDIVEASFEHAALSGSGINAHSEIDAHISNNTIHLTDDEKAAIDGSNSPSAVNPVATLNDLDVLEDKYTTGLDNTTNYVDTASALLVDGVSVKTYDDIVSDASSDLTNHASNTIAHHDNSNDPTSAEKAALVGSAGFPSITNVFVTDEDTRLSAVTPIKDGILSKLDKSKLDSIEPNATGDQTGGEIVSAINLDSSKINDANIADSIARQSYVTSQISIHDAITDAHHPHTNKTEIDKVTIGDHDISTSNPHNTTISNLNDTAIQNITDTNVLRVSGSSWINTNLLFSDIDGDVTEAMLETSVVQKLNNSIPNNIGTSQAPLVTDDANAGWEVGSLWVDTTNDEAYRCVDATVGAAIWVHATLGLDEFHNLAFTGSWNDMIDKPTLGETTTASNVGTSGLGVFARKTGTDLKFKNIASSVSELTVTADIDNILITPIVGTTANTLAAGDDTRFTNARLPLAHAGSHISGSDILPNATITIAGLMSNTDKSKLDGIDIGATNDQTADEIVSSINSSATISISESKIDSDIARDAEVTSAIATHGALSTTHGVTGNILGSEKLGVLNGIATLDGSAKIPILQIPFGIDVDTLDGKHYSDIVADINTHALLTTSHGVTGNILGSEDLGVANGIATLGADSKITPSQLPSSISDADTVDGLHASAFASTSHASEHLVSGSDEIGLATNLIEGLMSSADKTKLDSIADNATIDQSAIEIVALINSSSSVIDSDNLDLAQLSTHESNMTAHHSNINDPTVFQKQALAGTEGTPSDTNRYVTDDDTRLTLVTISKDGLMSFTDKQKLIGIDTNASDDQTADEIITSVNGTGTIRIHESRLDTGLVRDAAWSSHIASATGHHTNINDPTADQKSALTGTSGTPDVLNKYVTNSDSRLTNARTPTTHTHVETDIIDFGSYEPIFTKNTAFNKDFGELVGTVCQGNDSRLSNARTPTAHNHTESDISDFGSYIPTSEKAVANGVASLDSDSKIPASQLPALAITNTFEVANEAAMLALTADIGDVAIRSDENKSYILAVEPASILANWKLLKTPTDSVLSVDGRVGAVSLSDLYEASFTKNTAFNKDFGTLVDTVCEGNDSRFTDASNHIANTSNPHSVTAAQVSAVPLAGGTMTGDLIMGGNIVQFFNSGAYISGASDYLSVVGNSGILAKVAGVNKLVITSAEISARANLSMFSTYKIVNLVDPTADQDAATKKYVDDNAGGSPLVSSKTTAYTATAASEIILCDASTAAFTITLPAATGNSGLIHRIKKTDSSTNAITIDGNGAETIDGVATRAINIQWETLTIVCDGTGWYIL